MTANQGLPQTRTAGPALALRLGVFNQTQNPGPTISSFTGTVTTVTVTNSIQLEVSSAVPGAQAQPGQPGPTRALAFT